MINKVILEGRILQILFSNDKVIKWRIGVEDTMTHKKVSLTSFDPKLFNIIKSNIGNVLTFEGTFSENNYKDKNGQWKNEYTIAVNKIENESITMNEPSNEFECIDFIDEDGLPF